MHSESKIIIIIPGPDHLLYNVNLMEKIKKV